jgi:hypothetical protein
MPQHRHGGSLDLICAARDPRHYAGTVGVEAREEAFMWWGLGLSSFVYLVLLLIPGLKTLRNGHGRLFFVGIFFPLLWLVGAAIRPAASPSG